MGAAIDGIDCIGEGVNGFSIRIRILHYEFDVNIIDFFLAINWFVQDFFIFIQVTHKRSDATLEVKSHFTVFAFILEHNGDAAGDESHLAKARD